MAETDESTAKEQRRLGETKYTGEFGLKTPTLPPNWSNLLAAWEEASADLAKKAEASRRGRYAVVWASCDVAKAARGLVKKLSTLAVEADLYPETKAALPWLVDSARWEIEALRCAATAAGVLRGQEKIGMAPMQLEPGAIEDFATVNDDGTVTVGLRWCECGHTLISHIVDDDRMERCEHCDCVMFMGTDGKR